MKNIPLNERIIFALDFPDPEDAKLWVRKTDKQIKFFKVGLQLFLAGWWPIVDYIVERGNKVMLDLKFFDIPKTVSLAINQLKGHNVFFSTIHGNDEIIKAAINEKKDNLKILSVSVLTSFDEKDMKDMGMRKPISELVLARVKKALDLGCDGVVASALEAGILRKEFGNNFFIVSPGIRSSADTNIKQDDQMRVASAKNAILNGSDYLVIGRPISTSSNPQETICKLQKEIEEGLCQRQNA